MRLTLLVAIVGGLLLVIDRELLWNSFKKIGPYTVLICFCAEMAFCAIESYRIRFLSDWRHAFGIIWRARLLTGFLGNFLPGVVSADAMRVLLINKGRREGMLYTALLIIANRVYGLLALMGLMLVTLAVASASLPEIIQRQRWLIMVFCAVAVVLPLSLRLRFIRYLAALGVRKMPGFLRRRLRSVYFAIIQFVNLKNWAFAMTTSMMTGSLAVFQFWMMSHTIDVPISYPMWMFIIPFVTIATLLPLGMGAIGTQDASLVGIGSILGLPPEPLLAISVCMHVTRLVGTLPGLLYLKDGLKLIKRIPVRPSYSAHKS